MDTNGPESRMLQSIAEELGIPNLLEVLGTTPMRRLQPILVHAFKKRVGNKTPIDLLREYEAKSDFFGISSIPQDELYQFGLTCHSAAQKDFELIQTSPIVPLGLNAVLSMVSQNNVLSSIRGSEVVSDITTQLALECSLRRKRLLSATDPRERFEVVNLCTSGRVLRLQPFDKTKGYMQHFNLFALCSGGMHIPSAGGLAVRMLQVHLSTLLDVLCELQKVGYEHSDTVVSISDIAFLDQLITARQLPREEVLRNSLNDEFDLLNEYRIDFPRQVDEAAHLSPEMFVELGLRDRTKYFARLEEKIVRPLRERYPGIRFCFDFTRKSGLGYYNNVCFHIFAKSRSGNMVQLGDGGTVDWSAKLLGNNREAMVVSGIGSELMQKLFRKEE